MNWDFLTYELFLGITVAELVTSLLIVVLLIAVAKLITTYLRRVLRDRISEDNAKTIGKVLYLVVAVVAMVVVLPILGVNPSGLLVAGGLVAIVLGFASQSIVGNLISGIFLLVERPFKVGDEVDIDATQGYVEDIRIVSTTVRTYNGHFVRIPNEKVFTTKLTNYVANKARRLEYKIGVPYRVDARDAIRIIRAVVEKHPYVLVEPKSKIYVENLGDNAVEISCRVWVPSPLWWEVKTSLLYDIKLELESQGIHVPFPQREVWFNSELSTRKVEGSHF